MKVNITKLLIHLHLQKFLLDETVCEFEFTFRCYIS